MSLSRILHGILYQWYKFSATSCFKIVSACAWLSERALLCGQHSCEDWLLHYQLYRNGFRPNTRRDNHV